MAYLLGCHIYRATTGLGNSTLDISGSELQFVLFKLRYSSRRRPQMILTQKLSTLAFGLYDGARL